jgi:hypothetical protein
VDVKMLLPWLGAVCVLLVLKFRWYSNKLSVAHAALGDDTLSEVPDIAHCAL